MSRGRAAANGAAGAGVDHREGQFSPAPLPVEGGLDEIGHPILGGNHSIGH